MQPLFLEPTLEFEKISAQTQLSEDPNAWPQELLQELYKQAPYVSDFSPHVVMEKVDGEQGYGLGHVEIGNQTEIQTSSSPQASAAAGVRTVRVPVVIKDGMLSPFDLLVSDDSKVLPLTETRLRAAIFRPQSFDVTSRTPGDQSMIGQLYPPYRQSYGFGGSGMAMNVGMGKEGSALEKYLEKTASFESETEPFRSAEYLHAPEGTKQGRYGKKMACAEGRPGMLDEFIRMNKTASAKGELPKFEKKGSVLEAILPTINDSDLRAFKREISSADMQPLLFKNAAAVTPSLQLLLEHAGRPKFASHFASLVKPDVVQVKVADGGYRVKTASHLFWQPLSQVVDRGEAIRRFGEKIVLAADLSGAATMAEGATAEEPEEGSGMEGAAPVTTAGTYRVQTPDGQETVGYVIPNLIDIDGTALPLSLFTNGTQATVQSDVIGVPADEEGVHLPTADVPSGRGVFASEGELGVQATVPLTISASMAGMGEGEPDTYRAESFSGEQVMVSRQPNIQAVIGMGDGKMLIPEHWQWVPLSQADEISVESQEDGIGKAASLRRSYASVDLVSGGGGTFSFRGPLVEKLAHDDREMLGIDDTMFLLAGFGVQQDYGVKKIAEAMTGLEPVRVRVGRDIKLASGELSSAVSRAKEKLASLPALRQWCVKEAATLGDPTAVDTVLSLGFLNPENLMTFVSYLPVLEDSQAKLCDILLASRLGNLIDTPEGSVERAVRSLEAVLEGLKALAFQNN